MDYIIYPSYLMVSTTLDGMLISHVICWLVIHWLRPIHDCELDAVCDHPLANHVAFFTPLFVQLIDRIFELFYCLIAFL